ncbi:unnamed protein product [Thlaspi arvense]|uniref:Polygalacturonase n=1 Tax=Thlaspi arvense TaxID=13288 RepID=A0AAU9T5C0_THLAR|nr:unnamed protein product [Thlaspi arvense]
MDLMTCVINRQILGFAFVNNSRINGITSLNSKVGHFDFFFVHHFNVSDVTITAPGDSPNTDGIKFGFSSNIHISNTLIGTRHDCIATLSGNTNMDISNVKCGPGHGLSVGSLGKNQDEKDVTDLTFRDIHNRWYSNQDLGISASKIIVSDFVLENIQMINGVSHVQIQDLKLKNIYGTSMNKVVVNLQCSKSIPWKNVELININIEHNGVDDGPSTAV